MNLNIVFLVFSFLTLVLLEPKVNAGDEREAGITATGTCLKKVSQDRASVVLTSNILAANAGTASKEATKENQQIRDAVLKLNLANATLETTGFSVYEDKQYEKNKYVSKGFRAVIGLSVETSEISRIGEVIATASSLGVKQIDRLSTFVSIEKNKLEYESCLEVAAKNAKDKAIKLAKGVGVKLGKVLRIQEGSSQQDRAEFMDYSMDAAPQADGAVARAAPVIDARAQDMTVTATLTFSVD
jgi:uncharacterized protein YggE